MTNEQRIALEDMLDRGTEEEKKNRISYLVDSIQSELSQISMSRRHDDGAVPMISNRVSQLRFIAEYVLTVG